MLEPTTDNLQDTKIKKEVKRKDMKGKKRQKYIPTSEPLELPFCRICGKKASGIHFGIYSCEACKAFFRRCLQRKTPFKCDKGDNCLIDEQQKGLNCSACRLKKCLDNGMSKEGVRIGRYSTAERTNVIMEVKKLHASVKTPQQPSLPKQPSLPATNSTGSDSLLPSIDLLTDQPADIPENSSEIIDILNIPQDLVTIEEVFSITDSICLEVETSPVESNYSSSNGHESHNSSISSPLSVSSPNSEESVESMGSLVDALENNQIVVLESSQLSLPKECLNRWLINEEASQIINQLMTSYQFLQPFSMSLTEEERNDIFTHGLKQYEERVQLFGKMEFLSLEEYKDIYKKTQIDIDGRLELYSFGRSEMTKMFDEYVKFSQGIVNFNSLCAKDKSALLKASNFDFEMILDYRSVDTDKEMLLTYTGKLMPMSECCPHMSVDTIKRWADFCTTVEKLCLSPQEHALTLGICLTFQDRCPLESPQKVEEIQHKLIKVLEILLQESHKQESGVRLAKIMDLFVRLRDMHQEYHDVLEEMCKDDILTECIPEIYLYV
ncbi:nuclear receptor subfamily 1 group D member 2-like [Saccostrea echinata]|uniref:nuclear receptor subfamily 1 group D member 2-like n=1 Tax=Saccostrea echinata TaxID=191078 RepID=UPI002A824A93|nr:nuclear receptor subfamily 1 group D member 2-like [Saccostrea echinata]